MADKRNSRPTLARVLLHAPWIAWIAWFTLSQLPFGYSTLQPGPLAARGHQGLNCNQCHAAGAGILRQLPAGSSIMDQNCLKCHEGHESHHPQQVSSKMPRCVHCHTEHRGQEMVTHVNDAQCTTCHKAIRRADGSEPLTRDVASWTAHPEFNLVGKNPSRRPSRLHFSHNIHLDRDGILGIDGKCIRLECIICHQRDAAGNFSLPVRYDDSCRQCHPILVQLADQERMSLDASRRLLHHAESRQVHAQIRDLLVDLVEQNPVLAGPMTKIDEHRPWHRATVVAGQSSWNWVAQRLAILDRQQFQAKSGCQFCHVALPQSEGKVPLFEPTTPPPHYLERAVFHHIPHSDTKCEACHSCNYGLDRDVMNLPALSVCANCHVDRQPSRSVEVQATCAGCHTFHNDKSKNAFKLSRNSSGKPTGDKHSH